MTYFFRGGGKTFVTASDKGERGGGKKVKKMRDILYGQPLSCPLVKTGILFPVYCYYVNLVPYFNFKV